MARRDDAYLLRITDYWRRIQVASALESLKDERDGTGEEDVGESIIRAEFSYEAFEQGGCPTSLFMEAFARVDEEARRAHEKRLKRDSQAQAPEPATHIPVVFSPFAVDMPGERNPVNVMFGAAKVDRAGKMSVDEVECDLPPIWIAREYLDPNDGIEDSLFPLASAERYSDAIAQKLNELGTWPEDWPLMLKFFAEIWQTAADRTDKANPVPLYDSIAARYKIRPGWIRFERKDAKRLDIIRMYQKVLERIEHDKTPSLYREVVLAEHRRVFGRADGSLHAGQMGGKYPLAPSQRTSLLAYLQTPSGNVSAINGPPGTGKTTLLQSVIASEMVSRACAQSDPPLYVAAAATNQAVSNIIKAFRNATDDLDITKHPLADRWIPGLGRRYGAYFRGSKGEAPKLASGSIVCLPKNFNDHKDLDEPTIARLLREIAQRNEDGRELPVDLFLPLADSPSVVRDFLEQASGHLGSPCSTLDGVIAALHGRLNRVVREIRAYAQAASDFNEALAALGLDRVATYQEADDRLNERLRGANDRLAAIAEKAEFERAHDGRVEAGALASEDAALKDFDEKQAASEGQIRAAEDAQIAELEREIAALNDAEDVYEPLAAPTSMRDWLFETILPWARNAKIKKLRDLAKSITTEPPPKDIAQLREIIETNLDRRYDMVAIEDGIEAERAKRNLNANAARERVIEEIEAARAFRQSALRQREDERARQVQEARLHAECAAEAIARLREARTALIAAYPPFRDEGLPLLQDIDGVIDTTLRLDAFLLASHYWEARFLRDAPKSGWRSQKNREQAFRMVAMLTPCFVSTFDKLGTSFNIMKGDQTEPLWEFADALIVDEAGQASPDKGMFAFAFAKKAIVVGDELQLPPVNSSDSVTILSSIAQASGVLNDEFAAARGHLAGKVGIQPRAGSIMRAVSSAAYYDASQDARGMWLRDHFRCDERIIAFCNAVWYTGDTSLIPRTAKPEKTPPLPHFGHVHVKGKTANKSNTDEALAIVRWIDAFGAVLEDHYKLPLHDTVAVLTPFRNQRAVLRNLRDKRFRWNQRYKAPEEITMGTVHALQGAERPVILFSTVYDEPKPKFFFDREHTMLNVAVSRAKDSFIVFGDRSIFVAEHPEYTRPSTFLREYIFNPALAPVPLEPSSSGELSMA